MIGRATAYRFVAIESIAERIGVLRVELGAGELSFAIGASFDRLATHAFEVVPSRLEGHRPGGRRIIVVAVRVEHPELAPSNPDPLAGQLGVACHGGELGLLGGPSDPGVVHGFAVERLADERDERPDGVVGLAGGEHARGRQGAPRILPALVPPEHPHDPANRDAPVLARQGGQKALGDHDRVRTRPRPRSRLLPGRWRDDGAGKRGRRRDSLEPGRIGNRSTGDRGSWQIGDGPELRARRARAWITGGGGSPVLLLIKIRGVRRRRRNYLP